MTRPNNITQTMTRIGELPDGRSQSARLGDLPGDWLFCKVRDLKQLVEYIEGLEAERDDYQTALKKMAPKHKIFERYER